MKKCLLWIVLLCLAMLGLAACGTEPEQQATQPVQEEPEVKIYWNIDREDYPLTEEELPSRLSTDGVYRARFAVDGQQMDLFFDNPYLMADADSFDFVGMVVDENNYVQEVIPVEYCAGGVGVLNYYIERFDGEYVVCNAVSSFRGQRIKLKVNENTKVYNVGGEGLLVGIPGSMEVGQGIDAVMGLDGYLSHVFVEPPFEMKPVYWNVDRMYDSTNKVSTRESDALGVYTIRFAVDGTQMDLKTKDVAVVHAIDRFAAKCMHLEFDEEGYIEKAVHPGKATGGTSKASWYHVMQMDDSGFSAEKFSGSDKGSKATLRFAVNYKVYDMTGKGLVVGTPTDLRVGDQVHCLTDENGDVCIVFVVGGRYMELPIYWNIDRCYDSKAKVTNRICDQEGWYYLRMAIDGKQVQLRTQDKSLVTFIDSRAARACALELEGDVIKAAYAPNVTSRGQTFASWMNVTRIDSDGTVYAVKSDGSTDQGVITEETKVYNVSENARFIGCTTDLRVGDLIHGLKDINGKVYTIYVVSRPIQSPIYWNVQRMYNSKTKETTRTPDAEGYYHITLAANGKQETFKTKDKALMTKIDAIATQICGLEAYNGVIYQVYAAKDVKGYGGGSKAGWCDIIAMDGTKVTVQKKIAADKDYGSIYTLDISANCPVYNCSGNVDEFVGEPASLKLGDRIHSLLNEQGKIVEVFIVSRPLDLEIYWNIVKYDLDGDGHTTRPQDADGGYTFLLSAAGQQFTYKTYDQSIADYIDSRAARCTAMRVRDGIITQAILPTLVQKGIGGSFASWMNITSIDEDGTIHAKKSDGSTDSGSPIENCEIYDLSGVSGFKGIPTEVKVGDLIHGLKNKDGKVTLIYVIDRPFMAYCEACGKEVAWNKYDGASKPTGHVYLDQNVANCGGITVDAGKSLCLNLGGYNMDGKSNALRIFNIYGILNLLGEGTVTAHNSATKMAPTFYVQTGGTFNMYGGSLTSEFSSPRGAVGLVQATFNMYGGKIYGGYATTGDGGNLEIIAGTTKLLGGEIIGGTAGGRGNGVYAGGTVTVGGNVRIDDLFVPSGKKLTVQNDFTGTIGVIANGVFTGVTPAGAEERFTSNEGNAIVRNSDGTLSVKAPAHEHCVCHGTENHGGCTSVEWEPWTGTVKNGGHYYLTADLKDFNMLKIDAGTTVSICLNGHNIDGKSNALRIFNIFGTLNLCGEGTITAHNASTKMAPVFYVQTSGTFNMYGGNLTSEFSSPRGAVGLVQATFNMYGGKLYGGHATGNGGNLDILAEATVMMVGGEITGGTADGKGDDVYCLGKLFLGSGASIGALELAGNGKLEEL